MTKILTVVLWTAISFCGQPLWGQSQGQSPRVGVGHGSERLQSKLAATQTRGDQPGTQNAPVFVDVLSHPKSQQEAAQTKRENDRKALIASVDVLIDSERAWIIVKRAAHPDKHGWYAPDVPQYLPGMRSNLKSWENRRPGSPTRGLICWLFPPSLERLGNPTFRPFPTTPAARGARRLQKTDVSLFQDRSFGLW